MPYLLIAIAVTVLVVMLAWRGLGTRIGQDPAAGESGPRPRPSRRTLAPDDDPDFLREVDRRLRGEDKSS